MLLCAVSFLPWDDMSDQNTLRSPLYPSHVMNLPYAQEQVKVLMFKKVYEKGDVQLSWQKHLRCLSLNKVCPGLYKESSGAVLQKLPNLQILF